MRHIPTSVHMATEFFNRHALCFDTKELTASIRTFVKGGLCLFVPTIMVRDHTGRFWTRLRRLGLQTDHMPWQMQDVWRRIQGGAHPAPAGRESV